MLDVQIDLEMLRQRLKAARRRYRFTGEKVAELCDISSEYYLQIECKLRTPSLKLLNIFCIVLDVSPDYLLGYADVPPVQEAAWNALLPPYQSLVQEIETLLLERLPKKGAQDGGAP